VEPFLNQDRSPAAYGQASALVSGQAAKTTWSLVVKKRWPRQAARDRQHGVLAAAAADSDQPPAKQVWLFDPADPASSPPPCTAPKPSSPLKTPSDVGWPRNGAWRRSAWHSFCWWAGTTRLSRPWHPRFRAGLPFLRTGALPGQSESIVWNAGQRRLQILPLPPDSRPPIRASKIARLRAGMGKSLDLCPCVVTDWSPSLHLRDD